MNGVMKALDEKEIEARQMFRLIEEVSSLAEGVSKSALMKSAYVVLLYNILESTFSLVLERVHEEAASHPYQSLSAPLRALWVEYYFTNHPAKNYSEHLEGAINASLLFPLLPEYTTRIKLFSGNLDTRKMDEVLKKYGIYPLTIRKDTRERLLIIKNKRNMIAHGTESFKESCRNMTTQEIENLGKATFATLRNVIQQTDRYLSSAEYILLSSRSEVSSG